MPDLDKEKIKVELAKTSRSTCRWCRAKIEKDTPRIGIPTPFTLPDGNTTISYRFYHIKCIPSNIIEEALKQLNNQAGLTEDMKTKVHELLLKLRTERMEQIELSSSQNAKVYLEYSKSNRGSCRECNNRIEKEEIRVAEPSSIELTDGRQIFGHKFYHIHCYLKKPKFTSDDLQNLISNTKKRKSISNQDIEAVQEQYEKLFSTDEALLKILESIDDKPIKIRILEEKAYKMGINLEDLNKKIIQGLEEGIYFQSTPDTIQKL